MLDKDMEDIIGTINYIKEVVERAEENMVSKSEFTAVADKIDDRLIAIESKISGIHLRVDNETIRTKNLENRVRQVLPELPPAPSMP